MILAEQVDKEPTTTPMPTTTTTRPRLINDLVTPNRNRPIGAMIGRRELMSGTPSRFHGFLEKPRHHPFMRSPLWMRKGKRFWL